MRFFFRPAASRAAGRFLHGVGAFGLFALSTASALAAAGGLGPSDDALPQGAVARFGSARLRHPAPLAFAALLGGPDGTAFLSAARDGDVRLWDAAGAERGRFRVEGGVVRAGALFGAASAPGGVVLATNAGAEVWALAGPAGPHRLRALGPASGFVAASRDRTQVASIALDGVLHGFDLDAGSHAEAQAPEGFGWVAADFDPQERALWRVRVNRHKLLGRKGTREQAVAVLERGPLGAEAFTTVHAFEDSVAVSLTVRGAVAFVGARDGGVWAFDRVDGRLLWSLEPNGVAAVQLAVSAGGKLLATDGGNGRVRITDVGSGAELRSFAANHGVGAPLGFGVDSGGGVLVGTGQGLGLWTADGQPVLTFERHGGPISGLSFDPTGERLFSSGYDGTLRAWNVGTGAREWSRYAHIDWITALAQAADGSLLATSSRDGRVHVWAPDGTQRHRLVGHEKAVSAVGVAPDGSLLISAASDRSAIFWDPLQGTAVRQVRDLVGVTFEAAFAPDGRGAVVAGVELAWLPTAAEDAPRFDPVRLPASVTSLAIAPDSRSVAVGLANRALLVLSLEDGRIVQTLPAQRGRPTALAYRPDGLRLASACQGEAAVRLWETSTGAPAGVLDALEAEPVALAFMPDGKRLATGGIDGSILLWDLQ